MEKYILIKNDYTQAEQAHTGYGIALVDFEKDTMVILDMYEDVSTDPEAVAGLVDSCNKLKLSSIHLGDVVDDFICCEAYK